MSTSPQQESAHKTNIVLAEGQRQASQAAARASYNGLASGWAAFDALIRAADIAYCTAVVASAVANGLSTGPSHTLHEISGRDS